MQRRAVKFVTGRMHFAASCRWSTGVAVLIGLVCIGFGNACTAGEPDPKLAADLATLQSNGIEPSPEGALRYLDSLRPRPEQEAELARLVQELGHAEFSRREAALQQLLRMSQGTSPAIVEASQSSADLEIRWRARKVVEHSEANSAAVLLAAFRLLAARPQPQACERILAALPLCRRNYLTEAAHAALIASAGPNDLDLLRQTITAGATAARVAAAKGLASVLPPGGRGELEPFLADADEKVAAATARVFADFGDRRCLPALVRLLESENAEIRAESALVARMATGESFGYAPYDAADKRAAAVARWKSWLSEKGASAEMKLPLVPPRLARGDLHGNTLLTLGSLGRVEERDPTGKVVWSYPLAAWSAEKMSSGNVLIGSYNANVVVEVDSAGKIVWEMTGINAMRAKPLPGDRILIADFNGKRVLEVDRDKHVVWEQPTVAECFDCDRLANGNTVYGCPNRICEITPDGKVIRDLAINGRLNGLQALDDGNILVANYGENRVSELTPDGKVVWEFSEPQPCDVFRTPTGETLISTARRIIELGADKKTVREICEAQYGAARR
jgi:hypothetical protein